MMTIVIASAHVMYLSAFYMRSDWFFLVLITFRQMIHCSLQESRPVTGKPHVRCRCKIRYVSKFSAASRDSPAIARLSLSAVLKLMSSYYSFTEPERGLNSDTATN